MEIKMLKYLFLDLDGVMNNHLWFKKTKGSRTKEQIIKPIDPFNIEQLNYIHDCVSDLNVVISSTWKHTAYDEDVLENNGFRGNCVGVTPSVDGCRGEDIYEYIRGVRNENMQSYIKYAILDDDSDMLYHQKDSFFWVDGYAGLTPNLAYKITLYFNHNIRGA